ncbi:MAG: hypothetical protein IK095_07650 [Oscillospiraceae bacterium]|nr:hypothetical protein [Oscillospiraceae bacterium]
MWKKYGKVNPRWAQAYASVNGIASPYYIPSDFWFTKVCRVLNSKDRFGWPLFQDKNYFDVLYPGVRQPEVLVRNVSGQLLDASFRPLSTEEAAAVCEKAGEFIIKPSVETKGGKGIEFFDFSSGQDGGRSLTEILQSRGEDCVVQKVLRQHHKMAELNPDSINTVRVMTLLWKGQSRVLGALVRIGTKGCRVDNPHTSNGFSCVLDAEGKMVDKAYDRDWHPYTELPNGITVKGFEVPYYDRIVETVLKLHYRMPHFRIIGWDMTVSEEGEPIMIEANLSSPEIYFHQLGGGPLIQDPELFDEIMRYVTKK